MASTSEKSFGQRLAKARQLVELLKSIPNYKVSNPMLGVEEFEKLLNITELINQQTTEAKSILALKREERQEAYSGTDGLLSFVKRIRDFVASLPEGRDSLHYKNIVTECQKMISNKSKPKPVTKSLSEEGKLPRRISSSEKSFGSMLQSAKNILVQIKLIPDYNSAPESISILKFESSIQDIEQKNINVHQEFIKAKDSIAIRSKKYIGNEGILDCFKKIKLHIAAAYGKDSNVYLEVSRIKI